MRNHVWECRLRSCSCMLWCRGFEKVSVLFSYVKFDLRSIQKFQTRLETGEIILNERTPVLKYLMIVKRLSHESYPPLTFFNPICFKRTRFIPSAQLADLSITLKIMGKADRYRGVTILIHKALDVPQQWAMIEVRNIQKVEVTANYFIATIFLGIRHA